MNGLQLIRQNAYHKLWRYFLVICVGVSSCENDMQEVQALNKKKIQVDEGKNISSYMSQGGHMKAHLTAPLMLNYRTDSPYVPAKRAKNIIER